MDDIQFVPQPKTLKIKLFPHQLASIHKMEQFETNKKVKINNNTIYRIQMAINANKTGSGKTLEMIGLIVRDMMKWDVSKRHKSVEKYDNSLFIQTEYHSYTFRLPSTLILVGQSIISQWERELSYTNLKVATVSTRKNIQSVNPYLYDVILVTPTMYNDFANKYTDYAWKRFVFDEPSQIKISKMKRVIAGFYWFITATPNAIVYNRRGPNFMRSIFANFWYNDYMRHMVIKHSDEFIQQSYQLPDTQYIAHLCYERVYNRVQGLVADNILEMISAGNINGAIQALGGTKTDNIVELIKKRKLEDLELASAKVRIYQSRQDNKEYIKWNDKKTRLEAQLADLDRRFEEELNGECSICISHIDNPVLEPSCQHLFCAECLLKWLKLKDQCPMCRAKIDVGDLVFLSNVNEEVNTPVKEKNIQTSTKVETIVSIIKSKPEGKFLIFSAWDETFSVIRTTLLEHRILFTEIKGGISERQTKLERFRNGMLSVIFLNSKFNGAGINLQEATDVILYHEMSEDMETQVIGRANRIGRAIPLTVHRLVYE